MGSIELACVPFMQVHHSWLGPLERIAVEDAMYIILLLFRRLPSLHGCAEKLINTCSVLILLDLCWLLSAEGLESGIKIHIAWQVFYWPGFSSGKSKGSRWKACRDVAWMQNDEWSTAAGELLVWEKVRWKDGRCCLCQWAPWKQR